MSRSVADNAAQTDYVIRKTVSKRFTKCYPNAERRWWATPVIMKSTEDAHYYFKQKNAISLINNDIVEVLHKSCCVLEQKQRSDGWRSTDSWIK